MNMNISTILIILLVLGSVLLIYNNRHMLSSPTTPAPTTPAPTTPVSANKQRLLSGTGSDFSLKEYFITTPPQGTPSPTTRAGIDGLDFITGELENDIRLRQIFRNINSSVNSSSFTSESKQIIKNLYKILANPDFMSARFTVRFNYSDTSEQITEYKNAYKAFFNILTTSIKSDNQNIKNQAYSIFNDYIRFDTLTYMYHFTKFTSNDFYGKEEGEPGRPNEENVKNMGLIEAGDSLMYAYNIFRYDPNENKYYIVMPESGLCNNKIMNLLDNMKSHYKNKKNVWIANSKSNSIHYINDTNFIDRIQDDTPYNCAGLRYYLFTLSNQRGGSTFLFDSAIKIPSVKTKLEQNYKLSNFVEGEPWEVELTIDEFNQVMDQMFNAFTTPAPTTPAPTAAPTPAPTAAPTQARLINIK